MKSITFNVTVTGDGYLARAVGASIFTDASNLVDLRRNVIEAVRCHFDGPDCPRHIRLQFPHKQESIALV